VLPVSYKINPFQNNSLPKKMVNWSDVTLGGDEFCKIFVVIENTEIVNNALNVNFMYFTIPLGLMTMLLNMSVLTVLWKKEKTVVNQLMMIDCIISFLYTPLFTFTQSPYFRGLDVEVYCYILLLLAFCCTVFNRLCPVAIAAFR
jgi:hypothetical protein